MKLLIILLIFAGTALVKPAVADTWYLSPQGNDRADGRSTRTAFKSFAHAFSRMHPGDTLVLMDGRYSESVGTGIIHDQADRKGLDHSAAPPSGSSRERMTVVRAQNPGKAIIDAEEHGEAVLLGSLRVKRKFLKLDGLTLEGDLHLYNTHRVHIRNTGVFGSIRIGTNDHYQGNDYNLIEDSWALSRDRRAIAVNYRSSHNIWRRVVLSSLGCRVAGCGDHPTKKDGSIGITLYDSHHVSLQNVIVLDRVLDADIAYADFASAQHTDIDAPFLPRGVDGRDFLFYENEWLGCISAFSDDAGMNLEADNVKSGAEIVRIHDFVALLPRGGVGVIIANRPYNFDGTSRYLVRSVSVHLPGLKGQRGLYLSPELDDAVRARNLLVTGLKDPDAYGVRTGSSATRVEVEGKGRILHPYTRCGGHCVRRQHRPAWPLIPEGSLRAALRKPGIGAHILMRTGRTGSFFDDPDSRTLTDTLLWPWPNEARIRQDFCKVRNDRWCATDKSLTRYLWESLGSPAPDFALLSSNSE